MNKRVLALFVMAALSQAADAAVETDGARAFVYLGFPAGAEHFQALQKDEPELLSGLFPPDVIWPEDSLWVKFLKMFKKEEVDREAIKARFDSQLSFWSKRIGLRMFKIEEAFHAQQQEEFLLQMEQLSKDFEVISKDGNRCLLMNTVTSRAIEPLLRMQESTLPQRRWLSRELLQRLIPESCFSDNSSPLKTYGTYWKLLLLANAIVQYHDAHDRLPRDLSEIGGKWIDAWGRPILYSQQGDGWFLKSLGKDGADKTKYDLDNRMPLLVRRRCPILYSGRSDDRRNLWMNQELKSGTVSVRFMEEPPHNIQILDLQGMCTLVMGAPIILMP